MRAQPGLCGDAPSEGLEISRRTDVVMPRSRGGRLRAEHADHLIGGLLPEGSCREDHGADILLDAGFDVIDALRHESPVPERGERALGRQPDAAHGGQELHRARRALGPADVGAQAEGWIGGDRLHDDAGARAEQALVVQVVVVAP